MFYTLAKIFWVVAQPLSVIGLLVLAGIVLVFLGRKRLGLASSALALVVLVLCSFTTLGALVIRPLEDRFARPAELPESVDVIIVLGGSTLARVSTARGVAELNDAGDRLTDAVVLARRYPEARIVYSGGAGLLDPGEPEAETAQRFFLSMGIAAERLVLEDQSRNTDENAGLTAALLGSEGGTAVLVTSAFHMPRSVGLFRRVGLDVIPWPTDYRSSGQEGFGLDFANPVNALNIMSIATKEWVGLVVYHWTGRIGEVLPGPA
ncbi:MAG: YdcF family protein [Candidatus Devosia phytovorans]|uniref:YdcF family protein n=1 Tax=Candidatus Devosia phytovorans TaxID=3121372 RepID=A0AAJ5VVW8_9HYPH|nr:YdcF family protein [Devosia sp.]WEK05071.1 MAG: YdcF family protein [Devosia sp.]